MLTRTKPREGKQYFFLSNMYFMQRENTDSIAHASATTVLLITQATHLPPSTANLSIESIQIFLRFLAPSLLIVSVAESMLSG